MDKFSVTSNIVKLLKHPDTFKSLQEGKVSPIMVHLIPTHRCQLDCVHCCFKNRQDKIADMPFEMFHEAFWQFQRLRTTSWELTGGGEPTLWPSINRALEYWHDMGSHVGIITNGLGGNKVKHWDWFDWVRVSLNTLEYADLNLDYLKGIPTSFCYIWNENSRDKIRKVVEFANDHKTICRIAPDCIVSLYGIEKQVDTIRAVLNHGFPNNEYAFLSDFNIDTERPHHRCYIHMIKPCFYLDGWVYACPSAELAMENDKQIQPKTRICEYDKIADWYNSPEALKPKELDCSYCKYVQQQEFLEMALTETEFNEFA